MFQKEEPSPPTSTSDLATSIRRDATQAEVDSLPHIADTVPFTAWAVILAGAAERFTYFGIISPWREFSSDHPTPKETEKKTPLFLDIYFYKNNR
jgi:hypothetical protein